jgi:hypothetical protein
MNQTDNRPYPINTRLQQLINAARAADPFAAYPIATTDIAGLQPSGTVPMDTEEEREENS